MHAVGSSNRALSGDPPIRSEDAVNFKWYPGHSARSRVATVFSLSRVATTHRIGSGSPNHQRVVIIGYQSMKTPVLIARFDEASGKLALDERFRVARSAEPSLRMERITWPHGGNGAAVPHGAVFGVR